MRRRAEHGPTEHGPTEEDPSRAIREFLQIMEKFHDYLRRKKARGRILGHIHNLTEKALSFMYVAFHTSVLTQLSVSKHYLVAHCSSFQGFSETLDKLGNGTPNHSVIVHAAKKFCDDYDAVPFFWKQAKLLQEYKWEVLVDCPVSESADVLSAALDNLLEDNVEDNLDCPVRELEPVVAVLDVLINFSRKNAALIDEEADKERKERQALLAEYKAMRLARKQHNGSATAL